MNVRREPGLERHHMFVHVLHVYYLAKISCCSSAMQSRQRSLLSLPMAGDHPPPAPGVMSPTPQLRSIAVIYCGDSAKRDRRKCLEGSLASYVHTGGHRLTDVFPAAPPSPRFTVSVGDMDLGCGGDPVQVYLCLGLHRSSERDISYAL